MEDFFERENWRLRYERLAKTFRKMADQFEDVDIMEKEDIGILRRMGLKYRQRGLTVLDDPHKYSVEDT